MSNDPIRQLESALDFALRMGDPREEAIARVNLAATLLHVDKKRALVAFEEALSAVRRAGYRRGEEILGLNFALEFLERGDSKRARTLAERARQLSDRDEPLHSILARLNLARVYREGFSLTDEPLEQLREALAALQELRDDEPDEAAALEAKLGNEIALAGRTALECGDTELALAMLRIADPQTAALIDARFERAQSAPDIDSLKDSSDPRLDEPLALWRQARSKGRLANVRTQPPLIQDFAKSAAELFSWDDAAAKQSSPRRVVRSGPASKNGPAGWFQLAEHCGRGELSFAAAEAAAKELAIDDDDAVFLVVFAGKHPQYHDGATAGAAMQLAGRTAISDALGAKLLRTLAALTREPAAMEALLTEADERLAGGADDALRAEVINELAVAHLNKGDLARAEQLGNEAHRLATHSGNHGIAIMARGNLANVLMRSGKLEKALEILEEIAREQRRRGDQQGLSITELNIQGCRNALKRR